jgi:hypothetical protein
MTQHLREEDTLADKTAMRHLFMVIGGFVVFTIILATAVGIVMG